MKKTAAGLIFWPFSCKLKGNHARVFFARQNPAKRATHGIKNAKNNGFGVIIAAAGMAAHLAGVLAAHTTIPVIGIPIKSASFDGMDALLATVMMPTGIPVATVAVDGAANAGLLAVQILALSDDNLSAQLENMKKEMAQAVAEKDADIQRKAAEL